jgi:hypothetical protein
MAREGAVCAYGGGGELRGRWRGAGRGARSGPWQWRPAVARRLCAMRGKEDVRGTAPL